MTGARTMTNPTLTYAADGVAVSTIALTFIGILPGIAALLAAIWYIVQIYESKTVQAWLDRRRIASRARKLAKLEAKKTVILAEIDAVEKVRIARAYGVEKVEAAKTDAARGMQLHELAAKLPDPPLKPVT